MTDLVLLGDEAIALGGVHAGMSAAYAYPGTPSTEILEYLLRYSQAHGRPHAAWCTNEKTAYEEALGTSFAGRRAMTSMKHVGLNVAADPFMNSALVSINGGLVVVAADDPGMHSSQNEQDSRCYADFARIVCLEPANQQEAYDMTREAFDLSERFRVPVLVRIVTRLAHSRAVVRVGEPLGEKPVAKSPTPASWILLPANARRQWRALLERQRDFVEWSETCEWNHLRLNEDRRDLGVITTGIGRNYYLENVEELGWPPSHLHIGAYPVPADLVRRLAGHVERLLVLEEGYPYVERQLRGIIPPAIEIMGKESGQLPPDGELTPDIARRALGLPDRPGLVLEGLTLPNRPPQLCAGCPHADSFDAIKQALADFHTTPVVTSDIGCYTLGALPPYTAVESCVCMGASVGMAKGAAEAGLKPAVALIGDSTFLHSGVTPLMDAVAANTDMTLIILDNGTTAMTGGQPTILPSSRIEKLVLGLGVDPEHFHVIEAHHRHTEKNGELIHRELGHPGLSVIIAVRECIETLKTKKKN
ncbi:MAG: indolepyruvate ferredoxin oxidoreductase [Acidobacteria bacterium]|nr:MAG: indolepyruvate ferredoxin oxidoreductase [Acidobacteriota bacterium]RPJ72925.1 MAG: indolepyruvate ferredoxin oxidoreductase [Acidobacteriota bacterium]